ncbi:MAG TPA: four-helix bundle copper-binding protein [Gemmataceae bacterium]|nr:four-helix bundle copper-binding protein [Gemmataceae bacterium]
MWYRYFAEVLGFLAVGSFLLGAVSTAWAQDKQPHEKHAAHIDHCAKACAECMRECESCLRHCADLIAVGQKDHIITAGTCSDCSELCAAAAKIVSHRGPMAGMICECCAKACDTCSAVCEKFPDDEHMKHCAKACRDCSTACREMLKHVGQAQDK